MLLQSPDDHWHHKFALSSELCKLTIKVASNMSHSCCLKNSDLDRDLSAGLKELASCVCVCVCVCVCADHFLVSWLSSKPVEEDDAYTNRSWDLFVPIFKSSAKSFTTSIYYSQLGQISPLVLCFLSASQKLLFIIARHDSSSNQYFFQGWIPRLEVI
jgi:hypothetical protein